ncbi:Puf4 protein [Saccharomycopsis crataegensis]|uniref:Puf4 protein n=1 Tax=Saccharomycopsis crataegensis TaxID=43959 RepID=A0AAV5QJT5_9ASCO|nr:Puf4 protein [Saccharomycopsis crataegensis]
MGIISGSSVIGSTGGSGTDSAQSTTTASAASTSATFHQRRVSSSFVHDFFRNSSSTSNDLTPNAKKLSSTSPLFGDSSDNSISTGSIANTSLGNLSGAATGATSSMNGGSTTEPPATDLDLNTVLGDLDLDYNEPTRRPSSNGTSSATSYRLADPGAASQQPPNAKTSSASSNSSSGTITAGSLNPEKKKHQHSWSLASNFVPGQPDSSSFDPTITPLDHIKSRFAHAASRSVSGPSFTSSYLENKINLDSLNKNGSGENLLLHGTRSGGSSGTNYSAAGYKLGNANINNDANSSFDESRSTANYPLSEIDPNLISTNFSGSSNKVPIMNHPNGVQQQPALWQKPLKTRFIDHQNNASGANHKRSWSIASYSVVQNDSDKPNSMGSHNPTNVISNKPNSADMESELAVVQEIPTPTSASTSTSGSVTRSNSMSFSQSYQQQQPQQQSQQPRQYNGYAMNNNAPQVGLNGYAAQPQVNPMAGMNVNPMMGMNGLTNMNLMNMNMNLAGGVAGAPSSAPGSGYPPNMPLQVSNGSMIHNLGNNGSGMVMQMAPPQFMSMNNHPLAQNPHISQQDVNNRMTGQQPPQQRELNNMRLGGNPGNNGFNQQSGFQNNGYQNNYQRRYNNNNNNNVNPKFMKNGDSGFANGNLNNNKFANNANGLGAGNSMGSGNNFSNGSNNKFGFGNHGHPNSFNNMEANSNNGNRKRSGNGDDGSRFVSVTIDDFKGQVYSLCKDQHGCRFLQRQLDLYDVNSNSHNNNQSSDSNDAASGTKSRPENYAATIIFNEIYLHIVELMTDQFGNYLIQKLLDQITTKQRITLIKNSSSNFISIALDSHGTRALQKLIDVISTQEENLIIIDAFANDIVSLSRDLNGNHVVQKILTKFNYRPENIQFIFDAACEHCIKISTHRHGCCVLQRCLDYGSLDQCKQLSLVIARNCLNLAVDPFGNYVVQYVLSKGEEESIGIIVESVLQKVLFLSTHKFGSNVIEKVLRIDGLSSLVIEEILKSSSTGPTTNTMITTDGDITSPDSFMVTQNIFLSKLLHDPYGNYVLQTVLDVAEKPTKFNQLADLIRPLLPTVRNTAHGRRIATKVAVVSGGSLDA